MAVLINMFRYDIINKLISINNFKTYLEIGVFDGECINKINCELKDGVDPGSENGLSIGVNYRMTSDNFFQTVKNKKYDLIFIDGLHHTEQVDLDIKNSLNFLNLNGIIVLHDCNPPTELHTSRPRKSIQWNGDVYKSILKFRKKNSNKYVTVDTDWGVGILFKNEFDTKQLDSSLIDLCLSDWNTFDKNRKEVLSLISTQQFTNDFK